MRINIKIDSAQLRSRYRRIMAAGKNAQPAMAAIGEILISSINRNFSEGGRYSDPGSVMGGSNRWKPLSPLTIAAREKRGHWPGDILVDSGSLASSINQQADNDSVTVGPNKVYDAIQHFGGKAGRGGRVTIPPRPYMVVQQQDLEDAADIVKNFIKRNSR